MQSSNRRRPGLSSFAVAASPSSHTHIRVPWSRGLVALVWILALTLPARAPARGEPVAEPLTSADFAHGRSVQLQGSSALHTVLLPIEVYRGSVEPHLADLRVFNAAGEAVPHALRRLGSPEPQQDITPPLPLFRLPEEGRDTDPGAGGAETFWRGKSGYRVDARISEREGTIHLESITAPPGAAPATAETRGYLIDTSSLDRAVAGLELELADTAESFVVAARVHGTDDLVHFSQLVGRAAIARLDQAGHRLEKSRIELRPARHRYLKLTWLDERLPVDVVTVRARLAAGAPPLRRYHEKLAGHSIEGEPHAFRFQVGGEVPIDRLQVDLPRPNTVVEARLYSGDTPQGPWVSHFDGLLYELQYASPLRNPEISWPVTRQLWFKLVVSSKAGGLGAQPPVLDAAWRPEQLLFVSRGQPPFTLSYGRAGASASAFDFGALLAITRTRTDDLPLEDATLGTQRVFADPSVLEPPAPELPSRTIALWAALLVSVALVVGMSIRLIREMK
jgi:hypothetical protein